METKAQMKERRKHSRFIPTDAEGNLIECGCVIHGKQRRKEGFNGVFKCKPHAETGEVPAESYTQTRFGDKGFANNDECIETPDD